MDHYSRLYGPNMSSEHPGMNPSGLSEDCAEEIKEIVNTHRLRRNTILRGLSGRRAGSPADPIQARYLL